MPRSRVPVAWLIFTEEVLPGAVVRAASADDALWYAREQYGNAVLRVQSRASYEAAASEKHDRVPQPGRRRRADAGT